MGKNRQIKLATLRPNIGDIKGLPNNPRRISDKALRKLEQSIERDPEFMELRPIVVDEQLSILGGNQRYRACLSLGMKTVPESWVRVRRGLSMEKKKRFILVDNAPEGMAGEWDKELLEEGWELPELEELGFEEMLKEAEEAKEKEDSEEQETAKNMGCGMPFGLRWNLSVVRRKGHATVACALYHAEKDILANIKIWKAKGSDKDARTAAAVLALLQACREIGWFFDRVTTPQRHHEGWHAGTALARLVAMETGTKFVDICGFSKEDKGHHPIRNAKRKALKISAEGHSVLVIDDVATSGETMRATAEAIRNSGRAAMCLALVHYWPK